MKIPCRNPQSAATDTTTCNKTKRHTVSLRGAFRARRLISPSRRHASSVHPARTTKRPRTPKCGGLVGRFGLTPASWAGTIILQPGLAPHLPGQAGQSAAALVSGVHLLNFSLAESFSSEAFSLAESLISEAFSLVLSHIELSDEEPSLVMVSVGWAAVVP